MTVPLQLLIDYNGSWIDKTKVGEHFGLGSSFPGDPLRYPTSVAPSQRSDSPMSGRTILGGRVSEPRIHLPGLPGPVMAERHGLIREALEHTNIAFLGDQTDYQSFQMSPRNDDGWSPRDHIDDYFNLDLEVSQTPEFPSMYSANSLTSSMLFQQSELDGAAKDDIMGETSESRPSLTGTNLNQQPTSPPSVVPSG